MVILMCMAGSVYLAYVFSYLYIWTGAPGGWPEPSALPPWGLALAAIAALGAAVGALNLAERRLEAGTRTFPVPWLALLGALLLVAAIGIGLYAQWRAGVRPTASSYGALVYTDSLLNGQLGLVVLIMAGFTAVRFWRGKVDAVRSACLENTGLLLRYTAAQAATGQLLLNFFPRLA
jgi:cytochrome c oxidase subunit I+III